MDTFDIQAHLKQETALERNYRELFLKDGESRFSLEIRFSDGEKLIHGLHSVSLPSAKQEVELTVKAMVHQANCDRFAWRMLWDNDKETDWNLVSGIENPESIVISDDRKKKKSVFKRLFEAFFLPEDY